MNDDLARFLQHIWRPGEVREVRIPGKPRTSSGYFNDPEALVAAVARYDEKANLYVTVNPVNPALLARANNRIKDGVSATTSDADIVERRYLPIDIDPVRPAGISATDAESEAARDVGREVVRYLVGHGWPKPLIAMSGNGWLLLYAISLPNDPASTTLVAAALENLARRFNTDRVVIDTTMSNASRLVALVGTRKVKGDPTLDRPHRRSGLVLTPDEPMLVPEELLLALAPIANEQQQSNHSQRDGTMPLGWVRALLDAAGISYRELTRLGSTWYRLDQCPYHPDEDTGGDCGVGERPDGMAMGKCFHNRGAGKGWQDFKAALGLLVEGRGVPPPNDMNRAGLPFYSPIELASIVPSEPDWIAGPGLAAIGAITEIDGKIKAAGKTTFLLHMIRSVLDGVPFLNASTRQSRVIYVTEQSRETFADALRRAQLDQRAEELLILFREDIGSTRWSAVVEATMRDGYDVVVFDTVGKLAGIREENSAGEWASAMSPLQDLAARGRAVIVARHDRKSGGDVGDSGRGSSQASGDVDIILALRRPEGNQPSKRRVISSLSRYAETPETVVVELTESGYVLLGTDEAVATSEARSFLGAAIEREYRLNGTGLDMTALVNLGKDRVPPARRTTIQNAIEQMVRSGEIVRTGRGVKHDPYRFAPAISSGAADQPEPRAYGGGTNVGAASHTPRDDSGVPPAGDDVEVDLAAEALRIFSDDVIGGVA